DLYLEGSDQYRGRFNSSMTTSVVVNGVAPYKAVLSQGFVLDGKGRKMSKSIGKTIVPKDVSKKFGADILRLWVASI
ncbi:class I tRNA ligase family protein, partial [Lactococcus lactis]